jgi:hypothetical protein
MSWEIQNVPQVVNNLLDAFIEENDELSEEV